MFQRYRKFGCLFAVACATSISSFFASVLPSYAEPTTLQGNATHWEQINDQPPQAIAVPAVNDPTILQSGVAVKDEPPVKPTWMNGTVYSEKEYVLRTFYETRIFFKVAKTSPWAPSDSKNTRMFLKKTVLEHWRGYRPMGTVWVTVVPFGPPGNFYFASDSKRGPKGYLERIGNDDKGFPKFRYWFIDSGATQPD